MNYDYIMLSTKPHCTILWLSCINTFIGKPLIMREAFLPWFLSLINKINHSVLFWLLFLYFSLLFLTGLHEIAIETRRYFATVLQAAFFICQWVCASRQDFKVKLFAANKHILLNNIYELPQFCMFLCYKCFLFFMIYCRLLNICVEINVNMIVI